MNPIAPQLDVCRLLVGQDKLPDFTDAANPSEDILSQIRILERGLRYGGHVDSWTNWYASSLVIPKPQLTVGVDTDYL